MSALDRYHLVVRRDFISSFRLFDNSVQSSDNVWMTVEVIDVVDWSVAGVHFLQMNFLYLLVKN